MLRSRFLVAVAAVALWCGAARADTVFHVTPLVANQVGVSEGLGFGPAQNIDSHLVNPWGISFPAGGPFWVSDNGSGFSTLYNGRGTPQALVVQMPLNTITNPIPITGQVNNTTSSFNGDAFIFAGENGAIYGWRGALGTTAETLKAAADPNTGDVYKALARLGSTLIAANFRTGKVDVFNGSIGTVSSFADTTLPTGYAPFGAQNINGKIYVTFALQDTAKHDDVAGAGNGYVDIFDPTTGNFSRLISKGVLNSPWGLALAPQGFDSFSNALLVGNFGDGTINAFDPNTGAYLGTLKGQDGNPLAIDGLWGLSFGSGNATALPNQLFFTAGPNDEGDGLFGSIEAVPEPTGVALFLVGGAGLLVARRRRALTA
jgi:uncharacterized protein (TIGR03118 family)